MFKKKLVTFLSASLVVALLSTGFSMPRTAEAAEAAGAAQVADATMNLTQYVNPFAGSAIAAADFGTGGGAGMTFPGAAVPFGMMKWSPDTSWGDQLYGGYNYDATQIKGFSLTHLSGAGCRALQDVPIMPWVGPIGRSPWKLTLTTTQQTFPILTNPLPQAATALDWTVIKRVLFRSI